VTETESSARW